MKLFVSYTRRDGFVTTNMLKELYLYLCSMCIPFIHAVEESNIVWQQFTVISALIRSHAILLIESPEVKRSPWVCLELLLGKLLLIPIIRINSLELYELKHNNLFQQTSKNVGHLIP
jgi:hypothetical protein